jgi:hypothetical protein
MLINKWLVSGSLNSAIHKDWKGGFCLDLSDESGEIRMSDLYRHLQRLPVENPFAISFSGKNSLTQKVNDSYIENIISLFFQPAYFLANDNPVVFLGDKAVYHAGFVEKLSEKCRNQGLSVLLLQAKNGKSVDKPGDQFTYEVTSPDISFDAIIENWLSQYLESKNPPEIHFLFEKNEPGLTEILDEIQKKEMELHNTEHYKFANLAHKKQKLIEKYKKELDVKVSAEKNTQLYLSMQKKQTADNVEWYHHEYEILPTWYKRLGHIVKVMMGRRTFRSLFSDKAKKYKD